MQRYFVNEKKDDYLILDDSDMHHIRNVMRNRLGDLIECVYKEDLYICKIEDMMNNSVKIISKELEDREMKWEVAVAIALVKEQKMDLILQKLTELGVSKIIPVKMERSIVKLDSIKFPKKKERWEKICKEAAEQSKRTKIPEIMELYTVKQLGDLEFSKRFICSTRNPENLVNNYLQGYDDYATMLFVIGPEGGISCEEEDLLESFGYIPISLGSRIMRVETAAIYVASIINFCSQS